MRSNEAACVSDDSSECFWLVLTFISSTDLYVIGYNTQRFKTCVSLALYQPANAALILAVGDAFLF